MISNKSVSNRKIPKRKDQTESKFNSTVYEKTALRSNTSKFSVTNLFARIEDTLYHAFFSDKSNGRKAGVSVSIG